MKRVSWLIVVAGFLFSALSVSAQADAPAVAAKSAVLMEAATGTVLHSADPHLPLAPASVTKVMTLLLIMEAIDEGRIGWEDQVTASEAAAAKGGSQVYLKAGETMSVTDMVKSIAVSSANDCACAMAEHIAGSEDAFVAMMNDKARELGMEDTCFVNCTGLDDDAAAADHKTSAYDIALMSRQLLLAHPDITSYTTIWMDTIRDGSFGLSNTNKLVRFYPGATGLKTGFTAAAGYCLSASAQRDGMTLIAVVMGSQTSQQRFAACKTLLDYGFANFSLVSPATPEGLTVPVTSGVAEQVSVLPADTTPILISKAQKNLVSQSVSLEETVAAPVSRGQRLGTLTLSAGDQVLARLPLVAAETVPRMTWGQRFLKGLRLLAMAE